MYWQARFDIEDPDQELKDEILAIREQHKNYGYRRITAELRRRDWKVNKKKVQRLCQKLGIQVTAFGRKYRKYSSYKGVVGNIVPNRLNRRFATRMIHQKITTDTTEFRYYTEDENRKLQIQKLYLDPFMDLSNLEIISYRISPQPNKGTMLEALKEAIENTNDCIYRRTFHSDRGWAYQMKEYQQLLKDNRIFQSMSRKGNCLDNAPMENYFGLLKQEIYYGRIFKSYGELKKATEDYIKYYNEVRIKENLGWLSPVEYRQEVLAA